MKNNKKGGFTLLELLIVIAIIAILSVALVIVLNPAETLKKARDAQRISDLSTLKTAIGLYMTSTASPILDGGTNTKCKVAPSDPWGAGTFKIFYSYPSDTPGAAITDANLDGSSSATTVSQVALANLTTTAGSGWIPINFSGLTGGSPISNIPVDPVNTIALPGTVTASDLVYRYGCSTNPLAYEIDAVLESTAYTSTDNKLKSDGGNSDLYYETGTNLGIFGTGATNPF